MNIKRYRAKSAKEGIALVREELGPHAVILSTKGVKNEKGEDEIELLAAIDADIKRDKGTGKTPGVPNVEDELREVKAGIHKLINWFDIHNFSPLYNRLVSAGVSQTNAFTITKEIESKAENTHNLCAGSGENYSLFLKNELSSFIPSAPIHLKSKPVVVALVGPTGTGKTTTIAKLASNFTVFDKLKTALITIDTYRIAAVEQLKTYAEILDIPIEVVIEPQDFPESIAHHADADVIFVDTAGRSQRNEEYITELCSFFKMVRPDEIHLVVSMTTKTSDLFDIIENFQRVNPDKLIFTKLDETSTFGAMLDAVLKMRIPISYLTNGQNVPSDIERADSMKIAEYILAG